MMTNKKKTTKMAGPAMDAACLTYEGINFEVETFPRTKDDVWLLGKHYNLDEGIIFIL